MDTLALGYAIPAIRAHSGLAPVRQCSCRAYNRKQQDLKKAPAAFCLCGFNKFALSDFGIIRILRIVRVNTISNHSSIIINRNLFSPVRLRTHFL